MGVTGTISGKVTKFDTDIVGNAIHKMSIGKNKLSTMVLGRDASYLSNAISLGKCNKEDLKKLCEFLSLDYDKVIITEKKEEPEKAEPAKTPKEVVNLDALILGINQLYQIEKQNSETMVLIMEQIKVTNTKLSRFENLIGQIHANNIAIKESAKDLVGLERETKSGVMTIAGRVRDMLNKFKS